MNTIETTTKEAAEKISALKENTPCTVRVTGRLTKELLAEIRSAITNGMRITLDLADCTGLKILPANAFDTCVGLEEITLPECVTEIGSYAFFNCILLRKVTMGKSVIAIKKAAFKDCHLLALCDLPETVAEIGSMAFTKCRKLARICVTENLTKLGDEAFSATGITEFDFPKSLEKVPFRTFFLCKKLKKVTIAENVKEIGRQVFACCEGLKEVIFPNSLTKIGESAFEKCTIHSLRIPNGVEKISEGAFKESGIAEIILSESLSVIEKRLFQECNQLKSIKIPDNVTAIKESAFLCAENLSEVILSASLKKIGTSAFSDCKSLSHIEFPSLLQNLDGICFSESGLESVEIPSAVKNIDRAFEQCVNLKKVIIHNPLKLGSAFLGCKNLESVRLPANWTRKFADIYDGKKKIAEQVFWECHKLLKEDMSVKVPYNYDSYVILNGCILNSDMTTIKEAPFGLPNEMPKTVYKIGGNAFSDFTGETLTIPDYINSVERYAFSYCKAKKIILSKNLRELDCGAFRNCTNLTDVQLPKSLHKISEEMFRGCTSLTDLEIPENVIEIEWNAFEDCKNLKRLHLPEKLKKIYPSVFENSGIEILEFPESLECIEHDAFKGSALKQVSFNNKKCLEIEDSAFELCKELISLQFPAYVNLGWNAFESCEKLRSVEFFDSVNLANGVFSNCTNLETVIFHENNIKIPNDAFSGCIKLNFHITADMQVGDNSFEGCENITVDEKNLLYCANDGILFSKNKKKILSVTNSIEEVKIPKTQKKIYFSSCLNLKSVIMHDNITEIGFNNCPNLTIAVIPNNAELYLRNCPNLNLAVSEEERKKHTEQEWENDIYEETYPPCIPYAFD